MYPCKSELSPHPLLLQVACTTCGASLNKKELALHAHCGLCKEVLPQGPTGQKIHDAVRGCTACNDNAHIPMSGWPWLCLFRTLGYLVGVLLCLFSLITLAPPPVPYATPPDVHPRPVCQVCPERVVTCECGSTVKATAHPAHVADVCPKSLVACEYCTLKVGLGWDGELPLVPLPFVHTGWYPSWRTRSAH